MKILAIERETAGHEEHESTRALKAEAMRVWQLYQNAVIRELYFRQDSPEAILILECADILEARRVLDSLPLVQSGQIDFDIIPLMPYPGFGRLFSQ